MGVSLPQELYDAVIDCLQDDRRALEACSLTCIGWTSHARRYLFREVRLHGRRKSLLFFSALESSARAGTRIGEYVLTLALPDPQGKRSQKPRDILARCTLITEILRYVPNVERLSMYGFDWRAIELAASAASFPQPVLSAPASFDKAKSDASHVSAHHQLPTPSILPRLPRLKSLHLSSSAFRSVSSGEVIARQLAVFPQLCALDIEDIPDMPDLGRVPTQLEHTASIRPVIHISELKIDLESCEDTPTLNWLSGPWVVLGLRKLDVPLDSMYVSRFVDLVQGTSGSLLEELVLYIDGDHHRANVLGTLDLSGYPRLRSLYVRIAYFVPHLPSIAQLLSSCNVHGPRKIHLELRIAFVVRDIEWDFFSKGLDAFSVSLTEFSRRYQCPSVTINLRLYSVQSSTDLDTPLKAQRVKDRFISLVTAAEMDMVLFVNETQYAPQATTPSEAASAESTTERYATPPRRMPRPSP
ncbi:hypothetical protein FOMPIDRAFT_1052534 [Fomitopsis schrenkii]|uniref:F-box domain-containing protein n=1 Tax=Fomitopsis schrenkii TaxID=2126942 RepID=S8E1R2_FOMSC|nr:hypothetical protein FOMPIDRAFT_1052534 [Fomitopsis schrenkii]